MNKSNVKDLILKLLQSNEGGVTKENIVDYLDYVNKVRYTSDEMDHFLSELSKEKKVKNINDLWYIANR